MGRTWDAIVVGAGVVGCATAYYLARAGQRVLVVERAAPASGTSSASAGHTSVQGRVPGPALDLALASIGLIGDLVRELPIDFEYVQCGGLIVAEDETEVRLLREFAARQARHIPVEYWDQATLRREEPALSPALLGATFSPLDGYVNPMALTMALLAGARAHGAEVRVQTEVVGLEVERGRVRGLRTRGESLASDAVVNAAGVWSPEIARHAGIDLSVVPRKGQLIVTEAMPPMIRFVLSHAGHVPFREHGVETPEGFEGELTKKRYMKQARSGGFRGRFYVGSTSEWAGFDRANTFDGITQLCGYAVEMVPALARARLVRSWAGLRPRSRDGKFIIGAAPGETGLFLATGHDSVGVLYSAMTGKLLAERMVTGRQPALLAPFDPARHSLTVSA